MSNVRDYDHEEIPSELLRICDQLLTVSGREEFAESKGFFIAARISRVSNEQLNLKVELFLKCSEIVESNLVHPSFQLRLITLLGHRRLVLKTRTHAEIDRRLTTLILGEAVRLESCGQHLIADRFLKEVFLRI